jgi:predicted amidohydrolase YtcJ
VARFRELDVIASVQPFHAVDDMRFAPRRLGGARTGEAYRVRSFLQAGVALAFGTDWYVEPLDPRTVLQAAVLREDAGGEPRGGWRPEEKIAMEEALDLYTRGSAFAEGREKVKGTLRPGMLADLVVLGRDVLREPAAVLGAPVDLTVTGGRVVFER